MIARDYRYVNVSGVEDRIVGTILPTLEVEAEVKREAVGGWMTNRIEDLAFIAEAIAARNWQFRPETLGGKQDAAEFICPTTDQIATLKERLARMLFMSRYFDILSVSELGDLDDVSTFDAHVLWPGIFHPMLVKDGEKTGEVFLADDYRKMYHDLRRSEGYISANNMWGQIDTIDSDGTVLSSEWRGVQGSWIYNYSSEDGVGTYHRINEISPSYDPDGPTLDLENGVLALYMKAEGAVSKNSGLLRKWYVRTMETPTASKIQDLGMSVAQAAFGTTQPYGCLITIEEEAMFCPISDPTCIRNVDWNWEPESE